MSRRTVGARHEPPGRIPRLPAGSAWAAVCSRHVTDAASLWTRPPRVAEDTDKTRTRAAERRAAERRAAERRAAGRRAAERRAAGRRQARHASREFGRRRRASREGRYGRLAAHANEGYEG